MKQGLSERVCRCGLALGRARGLLVSGLGRVSSMSSATTHAPVQLPTSQTTCLVGSLETWPLSELLAWLHESQRSAMVRIGSGLDAGVLFFREGNLIRCEYKMLRGEEALLCLLDMSHGSFALMQRAGPDVRANIRRPTAELLLQYAVALNDNRHRETA